MTVTLTPNPGQLSHEFKPGSRMTLFALEHSKAAYLADFMLYGAAGVALAAFLIWAGPGEHRIESALTVVFGLGCWTLIEYALHRFVLHGLQPFRGWHAEHHRRPKALICAPTTLSAMLIVTLVFLPSLVLWGWWRACALTLGVLVGYLAYSIVHHATHHGRPGSDWLRQRKRWHALHHHRDPLGCFGVTTGFWDHVFGSTGLQDRRAARVGRLNR